MITNANKTFAQIVAQGRDIIQVVAGGHIVWPSDAAAQPTNSSNQWNDSNAWDDQQSWGD